MYPDLFNLFSNDYGIDINNIIICNQFSITIIKDIEELRLKLHNDPSTVVPYRLEIPLNNTIDIKLCSENEQQNISSYIPAQFDAIQPNDAKLIIICTKLELQRIFNEFNMDFNGRLYFVE